MQVGCSDLGYFRPDVFHRLQGPTYQPPDHSTENGHNNGNGDSQRGDQCGRVLGNSLKCRSNMERVVLQLTAEDPVGIVVYIQVADRSDRIFARTDAEIESGRSLEIRRGSNH